MIIYKFFNIRFYISNIIKKLSENYSLFNYLNTGMLKSMKMIS